MQSSYLMKKYSDGRFSMAYYQLPKDFGTSALKSAGNESSNIMIYAGICSNILRKKNDSDGWFSMVYSTAK